MTCARCHRFMLRSALTLNRGGVVKRYGPKCARLLAKKASESGQMDLWEVS
jgi:hypothetical protein